ncbi:hypothetical protein ABE23_19005 [Bacillus thuringiensis]|uniref:Uncharacterized protein n=3 Tax=Bacillus thuringiensis TaxID=1428 RepID=A0A1W6WZ28_BACTU|nr:hypothetical protein H175_39p17 [Bacillus thuringiensis serovar thuringiensis str. IS5056]ARP61708.1 hypothetical protein CAB88_32405 [Bacillus thuringiensis]ERH97495.1 hypothetical protein BTCBT_006340 [Bacillus thuringiensis T01-328]OTW38709.1 hypothetical protein BK698_25535 [Bacillus thuringiensis serovar thuringiensis]ARP61771.1 hypothetical protein CAB88_32795 [Bacillus thuringiensis]
MSFSTEIINQSMSKLGGQLALYFGLPIILIAILAIIVCRYFDGYFTRQFFGIAAACIFVGWCVYVFN